MAQLLRSKSDVTIALLFFASVAIGGFFTSNFIVRDFGKARASVAWPTVEGVVLSRRGPGGAARYVYSYDGDTYEATRRRAFTGRFRRSKPAFLAPAERVVVYVDPRDPSFALLEPGGAAGAFLAFSALGGAAMFLGVGGVVWTFARGVAPARERAMLLSAE